jgi:peptidoglycan hydrolase CwlO-like protein
MSTDVSAEELGSRLAAAQERLIELERERATAVPNEIAALDNMIGSVRGEINSINAKILSRVPVR